MRLAAVVLSLMVVSPAFAQSGPSFDCAKADNTIDRTICKDPELAKADREMAAAYTALLGKLRGAARTRRSRIRCDGPAIAIAPVFPTPMAWRRA